MLDYLCAGDLVEVNSGGQVLFCFFGPAGQVSGSRQRGTQSIDLGNLNQSSMAEQHADGVASSFLACRSASLPTMPHNCTLSA